jgi:hypothetical protein
MTTIKRQPRETKDDGSSRAQEDWRVADARRRRLLESAQRKLHTHWGFWKSCPHRHCHRTCACVGDVTRCHDRCWPLVPEAMKVALRAALTAGAQGMSPHDAARHAWQEMQRWHAMEARYAQENAEADGPPAAAGLRHLPDHRAPRVRRV